MLLRPMSADLSLSAVRCEPSAGCRKHCFLTVQILQSPSLETASLIAPRPLPISRYYGV